MTLLDSLGVGYLEDEVVMGGSLKNPWTLRTQMVSSYGKMKYW